MNATTTTPFATPRRDSRLALLLGLLALVGTLVVTAPKWLGWLLRAGIRIAVQLAILGLVLRYVSSYWPF